MIRDVYELRRAGLVWHWVDELEVAVQAWRAGMRAAARTENIPIRTFVARHPVPTTGTDTAEAVYALRTDGIPQSPAPTAGYLTWSPVDELGVPVERWRVLIRRAGRNQGIRIHTFLITPSGSGGQPVIYTVTTADPPEPARSSTRDRLRLLRPGGG
ncbi:hypothetical protein ACVGOW_33670 [Pseudonocardia saturnea]